MKLYINEIKDSTSSKKVDFEALGIELGKNIKIKAVDVYVSFYRAVETLCLNFKGSYVIEAVCDRCLEEIEICSDFCEPYYVFPENSGSDVDYHYSGESIELDDFIKEIIVTDIPNKILCSEDCRGLCQICGNNLNSSECGCQKGE